MTAALRRHFDLLLAAGLGLGISLGTLLFARAALLDNAYDADEATRLGLITTQMLMLLWLPLLASAWIDRAGGGALHGVAAWCAGTAVLTLAALITSASILSVLAGGAIVLAVSALLLAIGNAPCIFRIQPAGRRARVLALALLLGSVPFWTGGAIDAQGDSQTREILRTVAVWCAPAACLSTAWENFDYALLPRTYSFWMGPTVPYPPHPLLYAALVGALGGILAAGSWLWTHRRDADDDEGADDDA